MIRFGVFFTSISVIQNLVFWVGKNIMPGACERMIQELQTPLDWQKPATDKPLWGGLCLQPGAGRDAMGSWRLGHRVPSPIGVPRHRALGITPILHSSIHMAVTALQANATGKAVNTLPNNCIQPGGSCWQARETMMASQVALGSKRWEWPTCKGSYFHSSQR